MLLVVEHRGSEGERAAQEITNYEITELELRDYADHGDACLFPVSSDAPRLGRPLLLVLVLRQTVVGNRAPRRAFEVVELAASHRPQERGEAEAAERQREGDEIDENVHARAPGSRARSAFSVTRIDEPDIARAATSGEAKPRIAIGAAIKL